MDRRSGPSESQPVPLYLILHIECMVLHMAYTIYTIYAMVYITRRGSPSSIMPHHLRLCSWIVILDCKIGIATRAPATTKLMPRSGPGGPRPPDMTVQQIKADAAVRAWWPPTARHYGTTDLMSTMSDLTMDSFLYT